MAKAELKSDASRTNAKPESYGTLSHLWLSPITDCARSTPFARCSAFGVARAKMPNAPSTWSHAPYRSARSASASIGSKSPAFTSPALPTMIAGVPRSAWSASFSAARSSRPTSSRWKRRTLSRPMPSIASAFVALGWM